MLERCFCVSSENFIVFFGVFLGVFFRNSCPLSVPFFVFLGAIYLFLGVFWKSYHCFFLVYLGVFRVLWGTFRNSWSLKCSFYGVLGCLFGSLFGCL